MKGDKLSEKQALFVREYVKDHNATQAAQRAGYSKKTAYSAGQRLLKRVEIAKAIQKVLDRRARKVDLTAENILESIMDIRQMAVDQGRLNDALKANELLGKHLKLFTDRLEHSGSVTLQIINEFAD
jgi:phage terminase small subunit